MAQVGVLLLLWVALGLLTPLATLALIAALSPLANRIAAVRRQRDAASLLPTSSPIVGIATGWSPPIRWRSLLRLYALGFLAGPFGIEVATFLLLRWHMPCAIVVTEDDTAWVLHPRSKWRRKGKVLVGHESLTHGRTMRRRRFFVEGDFAGQRIGLFRSPTASTLVDEAT